MSSTSTPSVLHVTTGLEIGGGEVLLLNLAEAALRRGREGTVVSLIADGPMRQRIRAAGLPLHTLGMRRGVPSLSGIAKLVRLIREIKPNVVQGWLYHGTIAATVALVLSGRRRQTTLIHGIYGSSIDFTAYGLRVRLGFRLAALVSRFADAAVYNTVTGADWHRDQGFRCREVRVIANGIDSARFEAPDGLREQIRRELGIGEDETVAIAIARVDPMKGWDRLLRVVEHVPGLRLIAVGAGTRTFSPHPSRLLLGPREDVPSLLAAADLFVLPSLFGEGTSVALTEAMAAGLPVVVTNVGDNARIAAGCGRIVAPDDEAGLEQALRDLAADPSARAAFGAAARTRVRETCSIDAMLDAYYRLYREAA